MHLHQPTDETNDFLKAKVTRHVRQKCGMLESQLYQFSVNQVLWGTSMNSCTRGAVTKDQFQQDSDRLRNGAGVKIRN